MRPKKQKTNKEGDHGAEPGEEGGGAAAGEEAGGSGEGGSGEGGSGKGGSGKGGSGSGSEEDLIPFFEAGVEGEPLNDAELFMLIVKHCKERGFSNFMNPNRLHNVHEYNTV